MNRSQVVAKNGHRNRTKPKKNAKKKPNSIELFPTSILEKWKSKYEFWLPSFGELIGKYKLHYKLEDLSNNEIMNNLTDESLRLMFMRDFLDTGDINLLLSKFDLQILGHPLCQAVVSHLQSIVIKKERGEK
ncbi:MAG TPA: hypothetical protein VGA95_02060, partial [Thermodesulfobacteriota bacterium]